LVPQELAVHKAQHGMCPAVAGEMGIEVHGIPPAHAQDPPALGRPRCRAPERGWARARSGRQRCTRREACLQELATTQTMGMVGSRVLLWHQPPSLKRPMSSAMLCPPAPSPCDCVGRGRPAERAPVPRDCVGGGGTV
jgi:hypothetical protein